MAQMLPMVQIVPEMNLAYDPVTGVLGSSLGSGIVLLQRQGYLKILLDLRINARKKEADLQPLYFFCALG